MTTKLNDYNYSDYYSIEKFDDYRYSRKKGLIKQPILSYESRKNFDKPSIEDPEKYTWEITSLTYNFADKLVEKGEVVIQGKTTVPVTDELRGVVQKGKEHDEVYLSKRRRHMDKGLSETSLDEMMSNGSDVPDEKNDIDRVDLSIDLQNAMRKLSKKQRDVIYRRYFSDMTQKEVGKIQGKGESGISRLEQRALEKLKEILTPQYRS